MTTLAAAGDTWGISGPVFLAGYIALAVVVLIASTVVRNSIANSNAATGSTDGVANRPHDVAYLNGGEELAVLSALASMRVNGTITAASTRHVQAAGSIDPHAEPLERAIHRAAQVPVPRASLRWNREVVEQLAQTRARLIDAGLLLSADQRRRVRRTGVATLAVAGLGLLRLLAGVADAKPVGFLVVALVVVTLVAVRLLLKAPIRSKAGNRMLRELRTTYHTLAPGMRPNWATYGPAGAALGVGVFGAAALWAADPAFASELGAQRAMGAASSGWGGSGGYYGSSDGGGGSSSDGGGGCGGGGGGCGG